MIHVECPACAAPYDFDERRLPAGGLKMRCPKCSASFRVGPDGVQESSSEKKKPIAPPVPTEAVSGKASGPGFGDLSDLPAPSSVARSGVTRPGVNKSGANKPGKPPPPKGLVPPPKTGSSKARSKFGTDLADLPAPSTKSGGSSGVDLPAPRRIAPPVPPNAGPKVAPPAPPKPPAAKPRAPIAPEVPAPDPLDEVDLPAVLGGPVSSPAGRSDAAVSDAGLADLPAPAGPRGDLADLPAPSRKGGLVDLPAPSGSAGFGELDLPMPSHALSGASSAQASPGGPSGSRRSGRKGGASFDSGLDLPMPKPAPAVAADPFGESLDLPMPSSGADLPMPSQGLDLPMPSSGADLPMASQSLDLPMPSAGTDLPVASQGLDLPMPSTGTDLPMPSAGADLPVGRDGFDLPAPEMLGGARTNPAGESDPLGGLNPPGAVDPLSDGLPALDDDLALPEPRMREPTAELDSGGVGYGEVDLGGDPFGGTADAGLGAPGMGEEGIGDELEFADFPEDDGALSDGALPGPGGAMDASAGVSSSTAPFAPELEAEQRRSRPSPVAAPKKRGKALLAVGVVMGVLVLVGGALKFTPYGIFGVYVLERFLPSAGDEATVRSVIDKAENLAKSDTYSDARSALSALAQARRTAGLNRRLLARSLMHEALFQLRYGAHPASAARASGILSRLTERSLDAPGISLALAADSARRSEFGTAIGHLAKARSESAGDPYLPLVAGEIYLAQGELKKAEEAFRKASKSSAQALWGLARVVGREEGLSGQASIAERTLRESSLHVGARVTQARVARQEGNRDEAIRLAREAAGAAPVGDKTLRGSKSERAQAFTLLGQMYDDDGRRGLARAMFESAIEADPFALDALVGVGHVLLVDHQYLDALTRFDAAVQALSSDKNSAGAGAAPSAETGDADVEIAAKLGAAQAMLKLGRVQEAQNLLSGLVQANPKHAAAKLWLGKVSEALKNPTGAVDHYRASIELDPKAFEGYHALAELHFDAGRAADARAVLAQARQHVEVDARVHRMLGEAELRRGRLDVALRELRSATELDPKNTAAYFSLGVTLRRLDKLSDAEQAFAKLAEQDSSYPGLALERGRIYEAQGNPAKAVESYQRALKQRPDDPNLLLRLAAAQVAGGQIDDAERSLQEVRKSRPNSAEVEHFMGRVAFARGNLSTAMRLFDRAVQLDPQGAQFHLYSGWANLDSNNLGRAIEEVKLALELDNTLADAYWVRGRIYVRTGAVKDALRDFEKALSLNPGRHEVNAAMGEAYDQLGRRPEAIRAYERAVEHNPRQGQWWYRLGRLRLEMGKRAEATKALARSTVLGDAEKTPPGWLVDAHRLQGDAHRLGSEKASAIEHYQRFLELAPANAIDRSEVERTLIDLGAAPR